MNPNALAVSPKASPQVKQLIQAGDKVLMDPSMTPVIQHMIAGAKSLVQGAVPFLANLVMKLESQSGPLSNDDEAMLIFHLCGHFAEIVHDMGDPEAKNTQKLTAQLMSAIHQMMVGQQGQQPPMSQLGGAQPPQQAPQQPGAPQ